MAQILAVQVYRGEDFVDWEGQDLPEGLQLFDENAGVVESLGRR